MKLHYYICMLLIVLLLACDKSFNGDGALQGHIYQADGVSDAPSRPLSGQIVYLNIGNDTTTYVAQAKSDNSGYFSIASLNTDNDYTLFSRLVKDGIEYKGASKVTGQQIKDHSNIMLTLQPVYTNGMSVLFTDSLGGIIPQLPFRAYYNKTAAISDSTKYAFANTITNAQGRFDTFNIMASKYYFVSKAIFEKDTLKIFDSVEVKTTSIKKDTVVLK